MYGVRLFVTSRVATLVDNATGLKLTEHHEIGNNASIKNPPPMKIPPKGKRSRGGQSCVGSSL